MRRLRLNPYLGRALLVVLATVTASSAWLMSCGGEGDSNGYLCQSCTPGTLPCQDTVLVSGDKRPEYCGTSDPCTVSLGCRHKFDTNAYVCFPIDPTSGRVAEFYRCDGERPE